MIKMTSAEFYYNPEYAHFFTPESSDATEPTSDPKSTETDAVSSAASAALTKKSSNPKPITLSSPLIDGVTFSDIETIEALEIDVFPREIQAEALKRAFKEEKFEIAKHLLERILGMKVYFDSTNAYGENYFQIVCQQNAYFALAIIESGTYEPSTRDLDYAIASRYAPLVEKTLQRGKDFTVHQQFAAKSLLREDLVGILSYFIRIDDHRLFSSLLDSYHENLEKEETYDLYLLATLINAKQSLAILKEKLSDGRIKKAKIYSQLKIISHIFGVDKKFSLGRSKYNSQGLMREVGPHLLNSMIQRFLSCDANITAIAEDDYLALSLIENAITTLASSKTSYNDLIQDILNEKVVLIQTGWSGHDTYVVIYKNLLLKCNRGDQAITPGVEVYMMKKAITPDIMQNLHEAKEEEYFLNTIHEVLDLEKIYYLKMKPQKHGNCVWASAKAAIRAAWFAVNFKAGLSRTAADRNARKNYKAFTTFIRRDCYNQDVQSLSSKVRFTLGKKYLLSLANALEKNETRLIQRAP